MLFDWKSLVLMNVLLAVLKKDIEVARIDYSNSSWALLSSSSSPFSVIRG